MAIVQTVGWWEFRDGIEGFSHRAKEALFEYYDNLSDDLGENIEFDPIAIRSEWNEFSLEEAVEQYSHFLDLDKNEDEINIEDLRDEIIEQLENHTTVIKLSGGDLLIMEF